MKKRIVINVNKDYYCVGCTDTTCSGTLYDFLCCCIEDKEYTIEKVPETFSELIELCKELNDKIEDIQVSCVYEKHIVIQWYNDNNTNIDIYDDGTIFIENHLIENRTPAQIWAIIKNLIG